jgi:hypothetical protein
VAPLLQRRVLYIVVSFRARRCVQDDTVRLPDSLAARYGTDRLPLNIQHYFGTETCRSAFVNDVPAASPSKPKTPSPPPCQCDGNTRSAAASSRLVQDPTAPGFQYQSLGRILRTNVIHGPVVVYQRSVTHNDFGPDVFSGNHAWLYGRQAKPAVDTYRYRKDEFGELVDSVESLRPRHTEHEEDGLH